MFLFGLNENSPTFLYTLNNGVKKKYSQEGKSLLFLFFFKVYIKFEMSTTKIFGFQIQFLVSVYSTNRTNTYILVFESLRSIQDFSYLLETMDRRSSHSRLTLWSQLKKKKKERYNYSHKYYVWNCKKWSKKYDASFLL